jgi:hypothetical protein
VKRISLLLLFPILLTAQDANKGKQVVADAIEALGGSRFLSMKNRVESGVAYSFYRSQVKGRDIATIYVEYLDKMPPKGPAVREREAFGKKQDYAFLLLPDQGYEITYRGARPISNDQWQRYLTTASTNVFYLLRERWKDPKMEYDYIRGDIFLNTQVNIVDITTPEGQTVRVYFDYNTKVPIRQEYSQWDPVGQQRSMESTDYSKYRDVNGFQWPYVTHRERNGEKIFELFANNVQINADLPATTFELPAGAKILKKSN